MPAPAGPLTSPPVGLLTLTHAGATWRISSRPCDVHDGATSLHYRGGLAPCDVYSEAPITGAADVQSQSVEMIADGDIAALAAQGHLLSEVRAELALWREGDAYDRRLVMLSGSASVESGGFLGRPLRLSIVADDPADRPGVWPPLASTVCDETFGTVGIGRRAAEDGRTYPQVFGTAGTITVGGSPASTTAIPVIPVLRSRSSLIRETPWGPVDQWWVWPGVPGPLPYGIVSEGWLYPGSGASMGLIRGWALTSGSTVLPADAPVPLVYARDNLGRVVTLVDSLVLWAAGVLLEDREYYAAISPPCSGIARPDYRGGLEGAGQVIRWALEQSAITVDWRRTGSALAQLDRYAVAGFWDQSCSPWSWVVDNILPLLPCSWIPGPAGLYPVVWRLDATAETADLRLTDGLDCTIDDDPQEEGADEIRSRHVLDYGAAAWKSKFLRRSTWHGDGTTATTRESMSLHLRRAQQRYGSRRGSAALALEDVTSSDLLYADRSADRVLGWRSRLYSAPRTVLRVVGDGLHHRSGLAHLEPGMIVALTSARYSLSSRVAHVRRAGWLGGVCYADLVILSP